MKKRFSKSLAMTLDDKKTLNQVISAGYLVNCVLRKITK